MTGSSYLFAYSDKIFAFLHRILPPRLISLSHRTLRKDKDYDLLVVGYGPHGKKICHFLQKTYRLLVIEYDPTLVEHAKHNKHITIIQATATDPEIREEL